jgi:hypothetical protein
MRECPMNLFGEETVVTGSTNAVWLVATDIAWRPSWDPHGQRARYGAGFTAGAQGWSKPVGTSPGTFTIIAVQPERMWRARPRFRSGVCVARTATRRLADGKIRGRK